ncbi:MAG: hypothetical protein PHD22_02305, partial [Zoogloea sp.]|nr:hypothetical protein [Zoogloea sp.]
MRDPVETPASPSPESAPPRPGRWLAGGLRALLAGVLGLVTAAVLVVGWLGGTGAGLRFATGLAESLSGGLVVIDDAGGYLLGQLRLGRVHVRTPTLHLEVRNLHLDWQPGALLGLRLEVERLAASEVRVATVPSAEPARLPASLEAPLAVHLGELRIDRLSLAGLADGLPASPHLELTALAGQLDSDGRTHRFRHLAAATPFGLVAGEAELSGLRPFPLNMKASLATHQGGEAYDVRLTGDGSLESLTLAATASGAGMAGQLAAVATPFASLPLRSARLQVTDVNPRHFHEAAPAARLDIEVDLRPSVAAGHQGDKPLATGDWVVSGPLRIVNRAPDALDRGALPLESLSSRLRWAEGVLTMSGLAVRLPGKGRVDGEAQWQAPERDATGFGRVSAELTLAAVDARRLDGRAVATRIAGRLVARADAGVQTLLADLRDPQLALRVKARHEAGQVRIEEALVTAREARLEASGRLALEGNGRFEVTGLLSRFDPRAFVPAAPQADLNTRFTLQGQRHPRLAAHLDVLLSPSRLDGRSLSGSGRLAVDGTRVSEADVHLDLAGNRFAAQGRYGQPGDALTLQLDAPALASLGRGLGGRLKAEGVLRGTPAQPAGEFELQGEQLRAGALSIDGLRGRGRLAEGRDGAISILLDSGEVRTATEGEDAKLLLRRSSLVFEGTRAANGLRLEVQDLAEHSLMLRLRGRLSEGVRWEGFLEGVEVAGRFPVKLLAPAPLLLSSETVRLGLAEFQGGGGGLYRLEETRWQARQLVARGRMSGAQVGLILDPATRRVRSRGDSLQIGGEWDVNFGEQADGFVRIYREQGDLTLRGDTPVRLGLEDLQLTLSAAASRL